MRDKLHKNGILTESKDVPAHIVRRMFPISRLYTLDHYSSRMLWIKIKYKKK